MSRYSAEDALAEVYDAELSSADGNVKLYVGRRIALDTPDDVLGTVLSIMAERARDHYERCHGLHSDLAAGYNSGLNSIAVYEAFDLPPSPTTLPPTSSTSIPTTKTTTPRPW